MRVSPGTATVLADRLVEAGWLTRVPDDADRRSIALQLSAAASQQMESIMQQRLTHAGLMLDKLSDTDLAELNRLLGLLQDSL